MHVVEAMDVFEAMLGRRSVGKLAGDVSDDEIARIVEAAVAAPNHKLTEPWTFTVLRGDARARLGAVWAASEATRTTLAGTDRDDYLRREAGKPMRAPVVVAVSSVTSEDPVRAEEDFAATAAAVQNALLAAHALGLGAIWRTGAMVRDRDVLAHLGLAPSDRIVGFVYLGRPAIEPSPPGRKPVAAVLRHMS